MGFPNKSKGVFKRGFARLFKTFPLSFDKERGIKGVRQINNPLNCAKIC